MKVAGLSDFIGNALADSRKCECGSAATVSVGLCVSCLLRCGLRAAELAEESFDDTLAAIEIRDSDWQLGNYQILEEVARAIEHAHKAGILHRDLKPGNILLDGRGEPLVTDFGLAKWIDATTDLTRTMTVFGTPGYIAPEQVRSPAEGLTAAVDIYSLGAILFELLSGRPPFVAEHAIAVIHQAAEKQAPKLRSIAPALSRDLETICARCLERDPLERYQSAAALADDLERWVEGRAISVRPICAPARLWRWSRRNPRLAGSLAVCTLLLLAGSARHYQTRRLAKALEQEAAARHSIAVIPF